MRFLIWLFIYLLASLHSFAQSTSLEKDSLFQRRISREVSFNSEAQRSGKSMKIFVCFTVDGQGEFKDISIVNSLPVGRPFEKEVTRLWAKLPKQSTSYVGTYVLPLVFLLGEGGPNKLKPLANPYEQIAYRQPYKLLREVSVIGYIECEKISLTTPQFIPLSIPIKKQKFGN